MYSKREQNQIKKFERESFRELKEQENINKEISVYDDILYISDFTLKKYANFGDSGALYLATSKHNPNEKYILKHEYYDCACNEYMYSKIGNKMGIKIAPVKLFILNNKKDKFKSDFVCGIKYFENSEHISFNYIIKNKNNIKNWEDYFRMHCLEYLFEEGDGIEIIKYKNEIYRIDTTDAFTISDYCISPLAYDYYNNNDINIREFANKNILKLSERKTESRIELWKFAKKICLENFGDKYFEYYLDTFRRFEQIQEEDIKKWINILTYFYPNVVGDYFINYFYNLKLDVEQFLKKTNNKNLVLSKK